MSESSNINIYNVLWSDLNPWSAGAKNFDSEGADSERLIVSLLRIFRYSIVSILVWMILYLFV